MSNQHNIRPLSEVCPSVVSLYSSRQKKGAWIYVTVVLAVVLVLLALPIIEVQVSSKSPGAIRSSLANNPISAGISGQVISLNIKEQQKVAQGDTLMILGMTDLDQEWKHLQEQSLEHAAHIADLNLLLDWQGEEYPALETAIYQREFIEYRQQLQAEEMKNAFAQRKLDREKQLFAAGATAVAKLEETQFETELVQNNLEVLRKNRQSLWEQERRRYQQELRDLRAQQEQLSTRREHFVITAPISGYISQMMGIQAGNFISAGQELALISSDEELLVETYISSSEIGFIKEGMPVQFQVDAFNHHQWGLAHGAVTEIAQDVSPFGEQMRFVVKCSLETNHLQLANGYKGNFKKGMGLTAHFELAQRSLLELLFDSIDDWFDPSLG